MTVLAYLALGFAVIMGWQLFVERNISREFVLQNPFNLDPILQMKAVLRAPGSSPGGSQQHQNELCLLLSNHGSCLWAAGQIPSKLVLHNMERCFPCPRSQ